MGGTNYLFGQLDAVVRSHAEGVNKHILYVTRQRLPGL